MAIDESLKKLTKIFDQDVEITGTLEVGGNTVLTTSSDVSVITSTDISNWNTAYGWGNHADAGYLTSVPATNLKNVTDNGNSTDNSVIISNAVPLYFTNTGTGTYNKGVLYSNTTDGFLFEAPWETDATTTRVPFTLTWRGGIGQGGLKLNGDTQLHTNDSGLGIDVTIPDAKLHVDGQIKGQNSGTHALRLIGSGAGNAQIYGTGFTYGMNLSTDTTDSAYYLMSLNSGSTSRFYVRNDGLVGIGTDSPDFKLDVRGAFRVNHNDTYAQGLLNKFVSTYVTTTEFGRVGTDSVLELTYDIAGTEQAILNRKYPDADLLIQVGGSTHATFYRNGNVGIGTDSPSRTLHVEGNAVFNEDVRINTNTTTHQGGITMYDPDGGGYLSIAVTDDEHARSWGWQFQSNFADDDTGTTYFRIGYNGADSYLDSGDFGIGTTTPSARLHVYVNSTNDDTFHIYNGSVRTHLLGSESTNGVIYMRNSANTNTVRINASGQSYFNGGALGIGTTNPIGGKLHVQSSTGVFESPTSGSSVIDGNTHAIIVGPTRNRTATANTYYGGVAFSHLLNYSGGTSYNSHPQAWIGLRLYDTPGSERSNLVFATKEGTSTGASDIPIERMTIDPFGKVGIGTGSPSDKLHVNGAIRAEGPDGGMVMRSWQATASYGMIGTANMASQEYALLTDGTDTLIGGGQDGWTYIRSGNNDSNPQLVINGTDSYFDGGNVGIGTASPSAKLHIDNPSGDADLILEGSSQTMRIDQNSIRTTTNSVIGIFVNNDSSKGLRILTNGNIGVGTTSPSQKLHVVGKGLFTDDIQLTQTNPRIDYDGGNNGALRFFSTSSNTERMRITSAGNVGIGTTSPSAKLEIYGTGNTIRLDSAANQGKTILFRNVGTATAEVKTDGHLKLWAEDPNRNIYFDTSGGTKMTILSGGNVGIGTTSPVRKLHVNGTGVFSMPSNNKGGITFWKDSSAYLSLSATNNSHPSGWGWQFQDGYAEQDNAPDHRFGYRTNSFLNAQGGNVGIGVTSPDAKLHVNGGIKVNNPSTTGGTNTNQVLYVPHPSLSAEYFTMGFKDTARSGEVMQHPSGPYASTSAFYIECGSTEAGGICLDQDSVHVYGSSDGGATFRVIDKDADVVTFEMLQTSWNGVFRGDVIAYGSMSSISDRRIKENIEPYENVLDKLCSLGVYSYNKITLPKHKRDRKEIGVIAQEVEAVFPELVNEEKVDKPQDANGLEQIKTVDYEHLTAILLQSIKELRNEVEELKAMIK